MKEKLESVLEEVRTHLKADGGDIELVGYEDGVVTVRLTGACGSCPFAAMTLKNRVEKIIRERVPEVKSVEAA